MNINAFGSNPKRVEPIVTLEKINNCDELKGMELCPSELRKAKAIRYNGEVVGVIISQLTKMGDLFILYIEVFEEFREKGIASIAMRILTENGRIGYHGDSFFSSEKFWRSQGVIFDRTKEEVKRAGLNTISFHKNAIGSVENKISEKEVSTASAFPEINLKKNDEVSSNPFDTLIIGEEKKQEPLERIENLRSFVVDEGALLQFKTDAHFSLQEDANLKAIDSKFGRNLFWIKTKKGICFNIGGLWYYSRKEDLPDYEQYKPFGLDVLKTCDKVKDDYNKMQEMFRRNRSL